MLRIKKTKVVLSATIISILVIPAAIVVANRITAAKDTFAATMPSGFSDQNFYNCVLAEFQSEFPSETVAASGLSDSQLARITILNCPGEGLADDKKITNLQGLGKLTGLTKLRVPNHKISGTLDVSSITGLKYLYVWDNQLSGLNLGNISSLKDIEVNNNQLTGTLDVSRNTGLEKLYAWDNQLSGLNLGNISSLKDLRISTNQLTGTLDVSKNTSLETLYAHANELTDLNLGNISSLKDLQIGKNQLAGTLDVSKNTGLEKLYAWDNQLSGLNLGNISSLKDIAVYRNQLTGTLNVSKNIGLESLYAYANEFVDINMSGLNNLKKIHIDHNSITDKTRAVNIMSTVTNNKDHLEELSIANLPIGEIDASVFPNLTLLNVSGCGLSSLDVSLNTNLQTLRVRNNSLSSLNVAHNAELSDLSTDNIIVIAGIEDESLTSGQKAFDLSSLKFISEDGNTTIPNTDYYSFDSGNKILSVTDIAKTGGFVLTAPIDSTAEYSEFKQYKLQIAKIDSSTNTDTQTDDKDDSEDVAVPSTSGGTELGGKMDTGAFTNDGNGNSSAGFSILPEIAIILAAAGIVGRKYISHKKMNW